MSLQSKNVLLVADDSATQEFTSISLKPLVKNLIVAKSQEEGLKKIKNQVFDAVVFKTSKPLLSDKSGPFVFARKHEEHSKTLWISLGEGVEDNSLVEKFKVKSFKDPRDGVGLIKLLEQVFSTQDEASKNGSGMDIAFLNPLVSATLDVMDLKAKTKIHRKTPFVKNLNSPTINSPILCAMMILKSEKLSGGLSLVFEDKLIQKIADLNQLAPSKITEELMHAVFLKSQKELLALGHNLSVSKIDVAPKSFSGENSSQGSICIVVPFESGDGQMALEVLMNAKS